MPLIAWDRIVSMEGDSEMIPLFPSQKSLLIKLLWFLEDNPQMFIQEDVEDIGIDSINEFIDNIEHVLSLDGS